MSLLCFDASIKCRFSLLSFYVLSYTVLNDKPESIVKLDKLELETIAETDKFGTEARFLNETKPKVKLDKLEQEKIAQIDKLVPEARVLNDKLESRVKLDDSS